MRKPLIITVLMLVLYIPPANAENKQYGVSGVGIRSCGAWITDRKENSWPAVVDLSWVEGFLTAMDYTNPRINNAMHTTDSDGVATWIDNYCTAHPLDSISRASESLATELATVH